MSIKQFKRGRSPCYRLGCYNEEIFSACTFKTPYDFDQGKKIIPTEAIVRGNIVTLLKDPSVNRPVARTMNSLREGEIAGVNFEPRHFDETQKLKPVTFIWCHFYCNCPLN